MKLIYLAQTKDSLGRYTQWLTRAIDTYSWMIFYWKITWYDFLFSSLVPFFLTDVTFVLEDESS